MLFGIRTAGTTGTAALFRIETSGTALIFMQVIASTRLCMWFYAVSEIFAVPELYRTAGTAKTTGTVSTR